MTTTRTATAASLVGDAPLEQHALPDVPRHDDGSVDVLGIAARLDGTLLESSPSAPGTARFSYVVASTAGRLVHDRGRTTCQLVDGSTITVPTDPFAAIDHVASAIGCQPDAARSTDIAFATGLVGMFGYELAWWVEDLPPRHATGDRDLPDLDLVLADAVVVVDHATDRATLLRRRLTTGSEPADVVAVTAALGRPSPPRWRPSGPRPVTSSLTRASYRDRIASLLEHIAAGDIFQANIGQRLSTAWDGDLRSLYAALHGVSPAPFGAVHACDGGGGVASISPETFLTVVGDEVQARPMKGTRRRADDRLADEQQRADLLGSAKDRAENVMIVDLLRNDLGRVCVPGSIHVPGLFTAEAHPTVWQLVSTVRGRLRPATTVGALLRATFPCGSVTGAPKVRAMELIRTHEPVERGPWCGALGFVAPGAVSLSVTIRTAVLANGVADYAAGGGIVADSDPDTEVDESWTKALAFLEAVDGVPPRDAQLGRSTA